MTLDFGFPPHQSTLSETAVRRPSGLPTPNGQGLPEDLLREASRRVAVLCLISAFIWAVNLGLLNFVYVVPGVVPADRVASYWKWRTVYDLIGTMNIVVSLGLLWYTRRGKASARFLLDVALVYEVFTALSVALLDYAEPGPTEGVSWIAVIILLFAALAPNTPRKTLVAAFAAASMGPVAAEIWRALGAQVPDLGQALILSIPTYLCAGVAGLIAHIIHRLGGEVRKAREMGTRSSLASTPCSPECGVKWSRYLPRSNGRRLKRSRGSTLRVGWVCGSARLQRAGEGLARKLQRRREGRESLRVCFLAQAK